MKHTGKAYDRLSSLYDALSQPLASALVKKQHWWRGPMSKLPSSIHRR
jgi:hypothetical protein